MEFIIEPFHKHWIRHERGATECLFFQEPFDDINAECRDALSAELKEQVNAQCQYNSPRTKVLLEELFNYIILRLNKAAVDQDPENTETQ